MVELDHSRLAPMVASLLTMRGSLVPPLRWTDGPCEPAKTQLAQMDAKKLFAPHRPRDEQMLPAVRALLYLWNGYPKDVDAAVQGAPGKAQLYILGLALRHQGKHAEAKACFQRMDGHTSHPKLAASARDLLRDANNPSLQQVRQLLGSKAAWEPLAFVDLHHQAANGALDRPAELVIRRIQLEEFNLLLVDCYRRATGQDPTKQFEAPESSARKRRANHAPSRDGAVSKPVATGAGPTKAPRDDKVRLGCPKCRQINIVDASKRGGSTKCSKCGVTLAVPGSDAKAHSAAGVTVACPKCRVPGSYSTDQRGRTVNCKRCGAAMKIPQSKPAA